MSKIIKLSISLLFPAIIGFFLIFAFSMLILNTNIPENMSMLFSIISTCIVTITSTIINTLMYNLKGIYIAIFSFIIILLYKLISTIIINGSLNFTGQGTVGILFTIFFCFIGCIIGSNAKK